MTTKQQTFDCVAAHYDDLAARGRLSYNRKFQQALCAYRSNTGEVCGAGRLIPDSDYDPEMEGELASHDLVRPVLEKYGHHIKLVCDLQSIHDGRVMSNPTFGDAIKAFRDNYKEDLASIARDHNLVYKP